MTAAAERIRIGIIGTGQIGKRHLETYGDIPGAHVVALADINEAEARRAGGAVAIHDVYADFHEMLKRDDIQAVDVCLHNNLHRPATVAALNAGKHVYCEKPMAGSYVDALAMMDAARTNGRKLSIQLSDLFKTESRVARMLIDEGHLGEIYHARCTGFRRRGRPFVDGYGSPAFVQKRNSGGGALYDMGVYHISNMLHLLGNPPVERISGKTYQKTRMNADRQARSGYDVEELGLGFVRFEGEITLDIIEAWAIHLDHLDGPCILGSEGGIRLDPFGFFHTVGDLEVDTNINLKAAKYRWSSVQETGDGYDGAQRHWIAALQGRVELLPTAELALNTMLISEGIYLSNRLRREVSREEVREMSCSTAVG